MSDLYCCLGNDFNDLPAVLAAEHRADQCSNHQCGDCVCTEQWYPVCCKGEQFSNQCDAECHGFSIDDHCSMKECDTPCLCTKEFMPVCCNGKQYGNACMATCEAYDVDDDCITGECEGCSCPEMYHPVGCGGVKYDNECFAGCYGFDAKTECREWRFSSTATSIKSIYFTSIAVFMVVLMNLF